MTAPATRRVGPRGGPWPRGAVTGCTAAAGLLVSFIVVVMATSPGQETVTYVDDLTQLTAAGLACAGTGFAARRAAGQSRLAWAAISAGCGSWCIGQGIWSGYELVAKVQVPGLSAADPFFLLFPVGAALGLSLYTWADSGPQRWRRLLDGCIAAAALFAITWSTSLAAVARSESVRTPQLIVNLAYPAGDILVLTVVVFSLGRSGARTLTLWLAAGAMSAIAVADISFNYLSVDEQYRTGNIIDAGWVAGFLLLGAAGMLDAAGTRPDPRRAPPTTDAPLPGSAREPGRATMVPYIPLAVAAVILVVYRVADGVSEGVADGALVASMLAVLGRQYLAVRDNGLLMAELASREAQLQRQAFSDQLTGLANRALFTDRVAHALELHQQNLRPMALLFVDLDDFKAVNDTLGHAAGDELLVRAAERIRGTLRSGDTLARLGGDEFAVLVEDGPDAGLLGARIVQTLRVPFVLATGQVAIRASIGVTEVNPADGTPLLDDLFSRADIAMYAAKRTGKGRVALYEPDMVLPEAADLKFRPALARAIIEGTVTAVYQPIVHLGTGEIRAVEALARWWHGPDLVPQDYFIQLASRSGLMPGLTDLMLDRACTQLQDWSDRLGLIDLQMSVNVPPGLMSDLEFPGRVAAALSRHDLRAGRLVLEITEDALLGDVGAARAVAGRLRDIGVGLVLDDFGTGYSSLLSLRQIPLLSVKIDIEFVASIDQEPEAARFLGALLALGRDLELTVTAEGVERLEQAAILRGLGCQFAQGFLYSRPLPPAEMEPVLLRPHERGVPPGPPGSTWCVAGSRLAAPVRSLSS